MNLGFGLGRAVPEGVNCAWGARLIYPDDLVFNRQDLVGGGDEKAALIKWLNPDGGRGIAQALANARLFDNKYRIDRAGGENVVLHQDDQGVIVGSPNHSHGYLYVAGWLHQGKPELQASAEFERVVIEPKKGRAR